MSGPYVQGRDDRLTREPSNELEDRPGDVDEADVLAAMQFLSQAICVFCQTSALSDPENSGSEIVCEYCSSVSIQDKIQSTSGGENANYYVYGLFERLLLSLVSTTGPLAVRALIFLRRIVLHCTASDVLDYERSNLCKWCSSGLYSPDSAVRIQAAYVLTLLHPTSHIPPPKCLETNTD